MRPIDADIIIKDLTAMKSVYDAIELDGMIKALKEAPTIDAEPVKHGRWIGDPDDYFDDLDDLDELQCSVCGAEFDNISNYVLGWDYCPNCGAKMDQKVDYEDHI